MRGGKQRLIAPPLSATYVALHGSGDEGVTGRAGEEVGKA